MKNQIIVNVIAIGLLGIAAMPIIALTWIAINGNFDEWPHLIQYVLTQSIIDTIILLIATATASGVIGVATAWITSVFEFKGKKFFTWALIMPLAVPPYIAAYAMGEIADAININIRSISGAVFIFSTVLYPYVYLITRVSIIMQNAEIIEVARSLGASPRRVLWKIVLPNARPAIVVGVALVMMETLNDIGAVEYLGVRTITFAVFETWLNRDSLDAAVQLSMLVLAVIAVLIRLERKARRNSKTQMKNDKTLDPINMKTWKKIMAFCLCASVLIVGFVMPVGLLVSYIIQKPQQIINPMLANAAFNSCMIGIFTAITTVAIAFAMITMARAYNQKHIMQIGRIASLGYAVPGTVLALGLLYPLTTMDNFLARQFSWWTFGLLMSGSAFIVVYGCSMRFLAIAWGQVESGMGRISTHVDMVARGLGKKPINVMMQVHSPLLKPALAAAALFVFVETCKELSATLLLRPIGLETLATLVYDKASQAAVEDGAMGACVIIMLGCLPLMWLAKNGENKSQSGKN